MLFQIHIKFSSTVLFKYISSDLCEMPVPRHKCNTKQPVRHFEISTTQIVRPLDKWRIIDHAWTLNLQITYFYNYLSWLVVLLTVNFRNRITINYNQFETIPSRWVTRVQKYFKRRKYLLKHYIKRHDTVAVFFPLRRKFCLNHISIIN